MDSESPLISQFFEFKAEPSDVQCAVVGEPLSITPTIESAYLPIFVSIVSPQLNLTEATEVLNGLEDRRSRNESKVDTAKFLHERPFSLLIS